MPIERWKMRAIWPSVPPSRWMISIVSRFEPSALRAASHTAAALVAASSTISPTASHCSERTASNTGASQPAWASSRAEGTDGGQRGAQLLEPPRRWPARPAARRSAPAPGSHPPRPRRCWPSHGSSSASSSASGTRRTSATSSRLRQQRRPRLRPGARARPARLRRSARSARRRSRPGRCSARLRKREAGAGGDHGQRDHDRDDPRHRPGEPRVRHEAGSPRRSAGRCAGSARAARLTAALASRRGG